MRGIWILNKQGSCVETRIADEDFVRDFVFIIGGYSSTSKVRGWDNLTWILSVVAISVGICVSKTDRLTKIYRYHFGFFIVKNTQTNIHYLPVVFCSTVTKQILGLSVFLLSTSVKCLMNVRCGICLKPFKTALKNFGYGILIQYKKKKSEYTIIVHCGIDFKCLA